MRRLARLAAPGLGAPILALALACGPGKPAQEAAPPQPAPGPRTENPALGIALATVPATFRVEANAGADLRLVRADGAPGSLHFELTAAAGGVNLIEALKAHQEAIQARPGGDYKGQIELRSPLGTTFASRGRFGTEGATTEEFRIFAVHPDGDKLLTIVYSYPAGEDTPARRDELLAVLGEVEPAAPGGTTAEAQP
jgi:hypothetical protein